MMDILIFLSVDELIVQFFSLTDSSGHAEDLRVDEAKQRYRQQWFVRGPAQLPSCPTAQLGTWHQCSCLTFVQGSSNTMTERNHHYNRSQGPGDHRDLDPANVMIFMSLVIPDSSRFIQIPSSP